MGTEAACLPACGDIQSWIGIRRGDRSDRTHNNNSTRTDTARQCQRNQVRTDAERMWPRFVVVYLFFDSRRIAWARSGHFSSTYPLPIQSISLEMRPRSICFAPTNPTDRSIDRCTTSNTGGRSWDPRSRRRDQPPATSSKQQHHQHQRPTQASSATYRAWTHTAPSQHAAPPPRPPPESPRSCEPPPAAARGRARGAWAGG